MRSQTATEYLIMLAVVIIIALIVIGTLGGIPGIGGNIPDNTHLATLPVGVTAISFSSAGPSITLVNNHPHSVTITQLSWGELESSFAGASLPFTLGVGERRTLRTVAFPTGKTPIHITYQHPNGASYTIDETVSYQQPDTSLFDGLLTWWNFEQGIFDALNPELSVTMGSVVAQTSGVVGKGLSIPSHNFTTVTDGPYVGGGDFTIMGFIKPLTSSGGILYSETFHQSLGGAYTSIYVLGSGHVGGEYVHDDDDGACYGTTQGGVLSPNQWHHIAFTRSGDDFSLYHNGILVDTITEAGCVYKTDTLNKRLGFHPYNWITQDKHVDEVMTFNRPLSATEIQALYNWMT